MKQAGDNELLAPGQAVLSLGKLEQLAHQFSSDASKVAFEKVIASTCVRTMTNKNQRLKIKKIVKCCNQVPSKE